MSDSEFNKIDVNDIVEKSINWNDINFPVYFPLVHYRPEELTNKTKGFIHLLKITLILLVITLMINILDTIISVAGNYYSSINILYSFLNLILFLIYFLYAFYVGIYSFIIKEQGSVIKFYLLLFAIIFLFVAIIVIDIGCFNGVLRLVSYAENGEGGAICCFVLGVIEIGLYLTMIILIGVTLKRYTFYVLHSNDKY